MIPGMAFHKYIHSRDKAIPDTKMNGWLALSPLFVFLGIYLVSSIVAKDFYRVPIAAAFVIASAYAMVITRGAKGMEGMLGIFSKGAGNSTVLLMVWVFVLAGAFAATAKNIGAIDATVAFTLKILPGKLLYAGLFLAACFISMAIGTSVGTIVALVPIAAGIAEQTGTSLPFITAIIVGGSFFGDNLSFISDTTIAATRTQGCSMRDKFRANIFIAAPAALAVAAVYVFKGASVDFMPAASDVQFIKLLPYILVIGLAVAGVNVVNVLGTGIIVNGVIGLCTGGGLIDWMSSIGEGISGMSELIVITMLAGGMLEMIRHNGGLDFIIDRLTRRVSGKRGAEFCIAALVGLANFCTANNTVAIITAGPIAKDIGGRFGLAPHRVASILDTFSCFVQGIIPYGAQMLMASELADVSTMSIIGCLYYPMALCIVAVMSIIFRFPRQNVRGGAAGGTQL